MKVVEVIDLLSSPPAVVHKPKPVSNVTTSIAASTLLSGKSVTRSAFGEYNGFKGGKDAADEWFCLSDDPHPDHNLPAPAVRKPVRYENHIGNPSSWNFDNISAPSLTTSTASGPNGVSPIDADSAEAKADAKGGDDFFFLSDDFDTTIDLSDPFGSLLEPVAKRRRVTPEPAFMKKTISAMEKGKGISRSISDIATGSRSSSMGIVKVGGLRRSKTSILDDDPIVFSSSPDVFRVARDRKEKARLMKETDLDHDDDDDDLFGTYNQNKKDSNSIHRKRGDTLSSSDLDLPDVGTIASLASSSLIRSLSREDSKRTLAAYRSEKATVKRGSDKARKTQEKLDLKEAEKERKRAAKEDKVREKQIAADLAKANILRIDKKISTPEMILELPADIDARLAGQVRQFLGPLDVECEEWSSPIPNVFKWRRKVTAVYNEDMGHWEPAPKQIKAEKHVMCVMVANEFVDLAIGEEGKDLDAHVLRMKARFGEYAVIYLVEGLTAWMRKNRNVKNRQFTEAVRSQMAQGLDEATAASASHRSKKKKPPHEYVDEDMVEDALLRLQVIHGAQIHHTAATVETAEWVVNFTQHISTIPYRLQRMTLDTAFCMETGQVKTGSDPADTFIKMLQEVNRITAPIAYGIAAEYPSAQKLVQGFETEGKDMLQGLRKSANKDGAFTDREVGKKISQRLWGIFMGRDEASTDV